jgi:21S rRNA (GM2251-2'-O)-methyltransferase
VDENFRAGRQHGGRETEANIAPARGGRGGEWDDIEISGSKGNVGSSTRGKLRRGGHIGSGSKNDQEYAGREWKLATSSSKAGLNQFGRAEKQTTSTRNWGAAEGWKTSAGKFSNQSQGNHHRRNRDGYRSDRRGGYGRGAKIESLEENDDGGEDEEEWVIQSGREWGREHEANVNWRLEGEPVYGVAPIRAALVASRREFYTLYVQENLTENIETGKRKDKQALVWILNRMKELGVRLKVVSKHDLNLLVDNRPHQGLVLDASPLELVRIEKLDKVSNDGVEAPVWVALDEVVDPQNFGAILRSAYFLGATGVVVCAKNSAPLSGVVSKASAGALEVMEVQSCRNMVKFLDMSVQNGWRAVGASFESQAHAVRDLAPGLPTILVLGNEGRGLRTNVRRVCSDLVCIAGVASKRPLQDFSQRQSPSKELKMVDGIAAEEPVKFLGYLAGPAAVDSLNVSVAAGILLHELLAQSVYPTSLSSMETISHDTSIKEASSNCG